MVVVSRGSRKAFPALDLKTETDGQIDRCRSIESR